MDRCRACGGELAAKAAACPHCGKAVTGQESSSLANVIALIVVLFILVLVGSLVTPGHGLEPAKSTTEAAPRPAAGAPAKPARRMENTSAARASRGLLSASRAGIPIKR